MDTTDSKAFLKEVTHLAVLLEIGNVDDGMVFDNLVSVCEDYVTSVEKEITSLRQKLGVLNDRILTLESGETV